jgi:hypothetical protein
MGVLGGERTDGAAGGLGKRAELLSAPVETWTHSLRQYWREFAVKSRPRGQAIDSGQCMDVPNPALIFAEASNLKGCGRAGSADGTLSCNPKGDK